MQSPKEKNQKNRERKVCKACGKVMAIETDLPKFGTGIVKKGKGMCWKSLGLACTAKKK